MASQAELYAALVAVGIPADRARVGAAIGMAESSGNVRAHNGTPPDNSYGAWQINMIGTLGPARRAAYGLKSNEDLYDIWTSARVVKAISHNGANWGPWSTYKNGAYKKYLSKAVDGSGDALNEGSSWNPLDGLGGAADALTAPFRNFDEVIDAIRKTAGWVSDAQNWVRVGYVLGGALGIAIGLNMLAQKAVLNTPVVKAVTGGAAPVARAGKGIKAAASAAAKKGTQSA